MRKHHPPRARALSIEEQCARLRMQHPWLRVHRVEDSVSAEGFLQPTPLTRSYKVRITYRAGFWPKAVILEPPPQRRIPEQRVIHTNGSDDEPCLFTKERGDWNPRMALASTVVPWLAEWIIFYEGWLATGKWEGGGILPADYEQAPA